MVKAKISESPANNEQGGEGAKQIKFLAHEVQLLDHYQETADKPVTLTVNQKDLDKDKWAKLKNILGRYPGRIPVQMVLSLDIADCRIQLGAKYQVGPGPDFWQEIRGWQAGTNK